MSPPNDRVSLVPPTKHLLSRAFLRAVTGVDPRMMARRLASDTNREIRNLQRRREAGEMQVLPYVPQVPAMPFTVPNIGGEERKKDEAACVYPYVQYPVQYMYPGVVNDTSGGQAPGGYVLMPQAYQQMNPQMVVPGLQMPMYMMPFTQAHHDQGDIQNSHTATSSFAGTKKPTKNGERGEKNVHGIESAPILKIGIHVCKTCGAPRSPGYHRDHPLVPGQDLILTDCGRCMKLKDPECYTDSSGGDVPKRKNSKKLKQGSKAKIGNIDEGEVRDKDFDSKVSNKMDWNIGIEKKLESKKGKASKKLGEKGYKSGSVTTFKSQQQTSTQKEKPYKSKESHKMQPTVEDEIETSSDDEITMILRTRHPTFCHNQKLTTPTKQHHSERKVSFEDEEATSSLTDEITYPRSRITIRKRCKDKKSPKYDDIQRSRNMRTIHNQFQPRVYPTEEAPSSSPSLELRGEFPIPGVRHIPSGSVHFLHRQQTPSPAESPKSLDLTPPPAPSPPSREPACLQLPKAKRIDSYQRYVQHHERPPRTPRVPYPLTDDEDDDWNESPHSVVSRGRSHTRAGESPSRKTSNHDGKRSGSILRFGSTRLDNQTEFMCRSRSRGKIDETKSIPSRQVSLDREWLENSEYEQDGPGQGQKASSDSPGEKHVMWEDTRQRSDWHGQDIEAKGGRRDRSRSISQSRSVSQTRKTTDEPNGFVMSGAIPATEDDHGQNPRQDDDGW